MVRRSPSYRREQRRIDNEFFEARILRDIAAHRSANRSYIEDGIKLLELAHQAHTEICAS
jgi:hypothetical protein